MLSVESREMTGAGFWTDFSLPADAVAADVAKPRIAFARLAGTIVGLEHGAGFVIWITNGMVVSLEGCAFDGPWASDITAFDVGRWGDEHLAETFG